ncbi:MAG: hypothetical protein AB1390_12525 [Nitrospirota bacterium]
MNNNRHAAIREKNQEIMQRRRDAGSVETHFPEVASINMNITYNQKGTKSILRTFHFTPSSYAFFIINCLRQDCVDGGFDLTQVINAMVRNRSAGVKGSLNCKGADTAPSHSDIVYEVAIQYT